MEVDLQALAWGLVGVCVVIVGGLLYKNALLKFQIKTLDVDDVVKRLKLKEQYVKDLEDEIEGYREEIDETKKEVASWTGKYHQKGQIKKLDSSKYDLTKTSDVGLVVEDLLNEFGDQLPPEVQKIIKDPAIKDRILKYANEHPDQAVEYVKSFLSKQSKTDKSQTIPGFDIKNAV